ncbi:MAG: hypothetical protein AB1752_06695 [Candidatus Zixiibacteriota bacterium]
MRGISRGKPFPSLPVWTPDGSRGIEVLELLPEGGILFYVMAKCGSCVDAVAMLDSVAHSLGDNCPKVVVVTSANPDQLLEGLTGRGVTLPVWVDQQDLMSTEYNVRATRVWFRIGLDGRLEDVGVTEFNPAEYERLLRR